MTTHHVDTSAGVNGSGSLASPYNTPAGLVLADGDTVLFKRGTRVQAQTLPTDILEYNNLTVGAYGDGDRPLITGGVTRADWTFDSTNNVYFRAYASNIVGNVAEDDSPMSFVGFDTNLTTTAALMPAGSFSFDYTNFILYIKPTSGTTAGHVYEVAEILHCFYSNFVRTGLTMRDLHVRHATRHGVMLFQKSNVRLENLYIDRCGGYRSGDYWLGNGLEIGFGCNVMEIIKCEAVDIFDAGLTTQLSEEFATRVSDHYYKDCIVRRCGMHGLEISTHRVNQIIEDVHVTNLIAEDIGRNCWAGMRLAPNGGAPYALVCQGTTEKINRCSLNGGDFKRVIRAIITGRTSGVNRIKDVSVIDASNTVGTSSNVQVGERVLYYNVSDENGVIPTGTAYTLSTGLANTGVVFSP